MGVQIINGGFLTTIQDLGRYGYQETGMAVSGVMDTRAASLANLLVGNDTNEAVMEVTMMGPTMKFTEDEIIAVTGGDLGAKLDGKPVERYQAVLVKAGQTLSFLGMYGGSRAYIAFAGGLAIPLVMGSRSTNLKSKIGGYQGRKLGAGDEIGFRAPAVELPQMSERRTEIPSFEGKEQVLRVVLGPQDDCFTKKGIETFLTSDYTITNEYDRMGCRMEGPAIEHKNGGDIITDGISFGAVQVPSHGNPIVMMADHQTTGGYTKIANVISVDLPVLAQCVPGMKIRFQAVTVDEAQELYCREKEELRDQAEKFSGPVQQKKEEKPMQKIQISEGAKSPKGWALFVTGLFVMAFGVAFSIKASLGTSPISSLPYILSVITPLTVGTATIALHCVLITLQILILRKRYQIFQLLQLPIAILFGYLTDFSIAMTDHISYSAYWQQVLLCLTGILLVGIGVWMEVRSKVITLAGEGLVLAICQVSPIKFGNMKVIFDVSLVVISCILGLLFAGGIKGVREGTVAAAICVGQITKLITRLVEKTKK